MGMETLGPSLALFEGFWGRIFEYWPFFFTIGVTIVFSVVALGADLIWRRQLPPPPGATPLIDIPEDPRAGSRRWISRGKTLIRFGCFLGVFVALIYLAFANNPQGLNDEFGLDQEQTPGLVSGVLVSLVALFAGYAATVLLAQRPWVQVSVLGAAAFFTMTGPWIMTGNAAWLAVNAVALGLQTGFIILGTVYIAHGFRGLQALRRARESAA